MFNNDHHTKFLTVSGSSDATFLREMIGFAADA